ncbi:MAG: glycosyl transferase [Acidobacteriota bacterium]|nr:glycosyl transferase [Acidobacteriota bacterium]
MIEDPISPTRGIDTGEPQAIPPVWEEHTGSHPTERDTPKALEEMREVARSQSKTWAVTGRKSFSLALEKRRQKAARAILGSILKTSVADRNLSSLAAQLVANNQRLLRSTSLDIRTALRSRMTFPEVRIGADPAEDVPRAYPAASAYLTASNFVYDELSFIEFMAAAQENAYLEVAEIWLLKQMLQLVLLERFAEQSANVPKVNGAATPEANPANSRSADMDSLMENIRKLSDADFKAPFLVLCRTESILRDDPAKAYPCMDLDSRGNYHAAIQEFVRGSQADEFTIARIAVDLAGQARVQFRSIPVTRERRGHVGYYLVDRGRQILQKRIEYRAKGFKQITEAFHDAPELLYFISLEVLIVAIMAFVVSGIRVGVPLIAATLLLLFPASEAALEIINQLVTFLIPAQALPKLDFSKGIPEDCVTMVAIPTLLISEEQIRDLVRTLEIRYVGNCDPNLFFALLTDPPDSRERLDDKDHHVALCSDLIEGLNRKYADTGVRPFYHFHRHRVFNEVENTWMGWERKRGKLLDFNELLRGDSDKFPVKVGDLSILTRVRYVITLDSDTQLPRDSAHRLVGAAAHPLNRAEINPATNTVQQGYGVLQPRVGISVHSANRSRLAYIYSGQTGLDVYTRAVSDVYQDLFGEGIFTGKGIYDVDVFRKVLGQRFPSNAILSHDLIEGSYARTALLSDVEIIDDYPSHFGAHSRRKHRWIRGDWQILRWLFPRVPDSEGHLIRNPLKFVSRWKILDNLRRSVTEFATFVLLMAGWFFLPGPASYWTAATVALMLAPRYTQLIFSLVRLENTGHIFEHLKQIVGDFITAQVNVLIFFTFLAHQTLVTMDAIFRTVVRLTVTHRNLLEWETAAQSEMESKRKTPVDVYLDWAPIVTLVIGVLLARFRPHAFLAASPVLLLWFFSKPIAKWLDRPLPSGRSEITSDDEKFLRRVALRTWRFFRTFSTAEDQWLIPDNVQGQYYEVAHRISPTNLGLLFNSQYAAYDLGFITLKRFLQEANKSFLHTKQLPMVNGHFLNWYDTRSSMPLPPFFISSVDSGNLVCSLLSLKQGCLAAVDHPIFPQSLFLSLRDYLGMAAEEMAASAATAESKESIGALRAEMESLGADLPRCIEALPKLQQSVKEASLANPDSWWLAEANERFLDVRDFLETLLPWLLPEFSSLRTYFDDMVLPKVIVNLTIKQLPGCAHRLSTRLEQSLVLNPGDAGKQEKINLLQHAVQQCGIRATTLADELFTLSQQAEELAKQMDFRLLYDSRRNLLSVGYDVDNKQLLASCYDLLASESRSAVFIAIAKGDIPQNSWFRLGRGHTQYSGRRVLLSWTGTMFEYLMPSLWMKTYPATLLENSLRGAVASQRKFVQALNIPWGISEGACSVKNDAGHYHYHAYGVPPLALKVETADRTVITPYAAVLALSVDPAASVKNLRRMETLGWLGPYGFFESADYKEAASGAAKSPELVCCWMAHHQGMTLLAISNLLSESVFQRLFHEEVMIAATERLLHERVPLTFEIQKESLPAA